jgi:hypothetical protein
MLVLSVVIPFQYASASAAPPGLPLHVTPLQSSVLEGGSARVFVHTAPSALLTLRLRYAANLVSTYGGTADAAGRYVFAWHVPTGKQLAGAAELQVTARSGAESSSWSSTLLIKSRPPIGLFVATTAKKIRAGDSIGVFVGTRAGARIDVTISIADTETYTGTGHADVYGRWVYSTAVDVILKHQTTAEVTVLVISGLDQSTAHTSFVLQPGPPNLTPYGFDRLASALAPAPDLSKYFKVLPDKLVVVSTAEQTMREYQQGRLVHENYVTTGRPELPTVLGIFHVYLKQSPFTFISPWPLGSPFYYPPSPVRYWMPFFEGYGLHDSPWRSVYGPGTNLPHSSDPGEPFGSHGCVNIPLPDMVWLWDWAPVGTTVLIY